eukprot:COSAG02_NODE_54621_length_295_cov_0.719388_1_plen_43_part_01
MIDGGVQFVVRIHEEVSTDPCARRRAGREPAGGRDQAWAFGPC